MYHIDGLVQERRNSIANALELRLSCTHPSIRWLVSEMYGVYNTSQELCMCFFTLCFIMGCLQFILPIFFRVTSLALGQSYDCPSASEATLKNNGK